MLFFEYDREFGCIEKGMLKEDMERLHVQSSNIHSFWFKNDKMLKNRGTLYVQFLSGAVYAYYRVPESTVEFFTRAPSFGRYFWRNVRGKFSYQRIE